MSNNDNTIVVRTGVEEFDGDVDDVEMPDDVRAAAEARVAAAVDRYRQKQQTG